MFGAARQQLRERDDLTPWRLACIERELDHLNDPLRVEVVVQYVVGLALRGVAHMFGVDFPLLPLAS